MRFILASNSPRRREILKELNYDFEVKTADFDESTVDLSDPAEGVQQLALGKAMAAADDVASPARTVLLGADTVVVRNGAVMGKPVDENEAFLMLSALSGQTHTVYTGVAAVVKENGAVVSSETLVEATDVTFFDLTEEEIRGYIATGEPMDKAGAYGIQGLGCVLVKGIRGDYLTVVGLPAARVVRLLKSLGVEPVGTPHM